MSPEEHERLLKAQAQRHAARAAKQPGYLESKYPDAALRRQAERREEAAFAELFARGLDPKRPRRFRGRIDLTVQCAPRGHELANVYPTSAGRLFVPSVAEAPYRQEPLPPKSLTRRSSRDSMKVFIDMGLTLGAGPAGAERDAWIEIYDDDDGGVSAHIRGAGLVEPERWKDERYADAGHHLLCRCGTRALWVRDLGRALHDGTRRLFV